MRKFLVSISIGLLALLSQSAWAQTAQAPLQECYVDSVGSKMKYAATIEMSKGYISGICILMTDEDGLVKGSLFNEFGISAIDFTYRRGDKKAKFVNVIQMLNKWYVKRVLSRDLVQVIHHLQDGLPTYRNEKYKIDYKFTVLKDATPE